MSGVQFNKKIFAFAFAFVFVFALVFIFAFVCDLCPDRRKK